MPASRTRPHERSYPTLSGDTSPAAEAVQLETYRKMPAWRKIELVLEAIDLSRALAMAGVRDRYPQAGEEDLRRRFLGVWLGEDLATRVYGPLEDAR